jgi:hypothetical protein
MTLFAHFSRAPFRHIVRRKTTIPFASSHVKHDVKQPFPTGLQYVQDFIPDKEQQLCILEIKNVMDRFSASVRSSSQFKRSILNFHSRTFHSTVPELMPTLYSHIVRTVEQGIFEQIPNTIQINQYNNDNYGCPMHCDAKSLGPVIAMFSFQSQAVMHMLLDPPPNVSQEEVERMKAQVRLLLEPGSMLVMSEDVRYKWLHGIKQDPESQDWDGKIIPKQERQSVVFWYQK